MDSVVKKSLAAPIRQLTCCVSGGKESGAWVRRGTKKIWGSKEKNTSPRTSEAALEPARVRSYQADLEKERKLRAAKNAQKNAERAAMRAQFRSKHQLAKNPKDINHLKAVGRKVALPRELAAMVRPEAPAKDAGLIGAFQGLGLNLGMLSSNKQPPTPAASREQCRVM